MTLWQAFMCWLILNELVALAFLRRAYFSGHFAREISHSAQSQTSAAKPSGINDSNKYDTVSS